MNTPLDAPSSLPLPPVRSVPLDRPFRWLALGWRDFRRALAPSLLHGVLLALGGLAIVAIGWGRIDLLSGAFSGFFLVAPVLATGLYELSRRLALGERPTLEHVIAAWRRGTRPLVWFGLLLMVAGTFWVLISVLLIALFVQHPITGLNDFLRYVVLSEESHLFELWVALGGVLAALVFAATVVSAPLLLDRDVDLLTALLTSVRAVGENPVTMALWATLIMTGTLIGMATLLAGLVVIVPVLGHASWHAYADTVDASGLPPRI